jgi:ferrochelatase
MSNDFASPPTGVLLMAYGGPNSLDELPGYLADIRSGRPTTRAVLDEMTHNYRQIGGKSPLLEISRQQGAALETLLNGEAARPRYKVYLGMRHWSPWLEDTVRAMLDDGIQRAVGIVLAPHYSSFSVAKYQERVKQGLALNRGSIEFDFVDSYNTAPKYIEALANRVREGIARFPASDQSEVHVILSAHSLPVRIIRLGDPYKEQLLETAGLVAQAAGLSAEQWTWSFQSAGRSPEPWLGPPLEETITNLAGRGFNKLVSVPVGFVSDHVEMLYDIDIKAQALARQLGVRLERPPALNLDPLFIETLADLVHTHSARWQSFSEG